MTNQDSNFTHRDGVSLKEYIESRLKSMDRAVESARRDMERRMDGFPQQFVKKGETDALIAQLASDVKTLNTAKDRMEGKASQQAVNLSIIIAITSLLVTVLNIVFRLIKI